MRDLDAAAKYIEDELPNCVWEFGLILNPRHLTAPIGPGVGISILSPDGKTRVWEKAPLDGSILPTVHRAVYRMRLRLDGDTTA